MTDDEILSDVLRAEGGFRAAVTRPDGSVDPATMRGITEPRARAWFKHDRPMTDRELQVLVSADVARAIYRQTYIDAPGFTAEHIPYEPLRKQLIDFGINSGTARAVRWLQRVLGTVDDGVLGPETIRVLHWWHRQLADARRPGLAVVNDALVAARSYMIDQSVDGGRMRKADEEGVESRALSFFLAKP